MKRTPLQRAAKTLKELSSVAEPLGKILQALFYIYKIIRLVIHF